MRRLREACGLTNDIQLLLLASVSGAALAAICHLAFAGQLDGSHFGMWLAGTTIGLVGWWAAAQWRPFIRSMGPTRLRAHVYWRSAFAALAIACLLNVLAPVLVRATTSRHVGIATAEPAPPPAPASSSSAASSAAEFRKPPSLEETSSAQARSVSKSDPSFRSTSGQGSSHDIRLPDAAQKALDGATLAASQALQAAKDAEEKAKEIKTNQSDWGTLFAWLLAVVAVVISFVTSWVLMLSREVKTQADEVYAALEVETRYRELILRMDLEHALRSLRALHDGLDPNSGYSTRSAANALAAALSYAPRLLDPLEDALEIEAGLFKARAALNAHVARGGVTQELGRLIGGKVLPCLEAHHAAAREAAQCQREPGSAAVDRLAEFIRTCRGI